MALLLSAMQGNWSSLSAVLTGFYHNAAEAGGAIYLSSTDIIGIEGTEFHQNKAGSGGGAVACIDCASFYMISSSLYGNSAGIRGGALDMNVGHQFSLTG